MKTKKAIILLVVLSVALFTACGEESTPKPRGYFRIDIPEHSFIRYDNAKPFSFDYADYAIVKNSNNAQHPNWLYLDYPNFNARIYLSYNRIDSNFNQMIDDAHELAFKHISVANDIQQKIIMYPENNVYGLFYIIKGAKVASPINFYITDSTTHFMRGALYFNSKPQNDSLSPVIKGIRKDLWHMVESFEWKENDV